MTEFPGPGSPKVPEAWRARRAEKFFTVPRNLSGGLGNYSRSQDFTPGRPRRLKSRAAGLNSADLDWELEPPASDLVLSRCTVALALSRCNAALALSRCIGALALSRCDCGVGAVALSRCKIELQRDSTKHCLHEPLAPFNHWIPAGRTAVYRHRRCAGSAAVRGGSGGWAKNGENGERGRFAAAAPPFPQLYPYGVVPPVTVKSAAPSEPSKQLAGVVTMLGLSAAAGCATCPVFKTAQPFASVTITS